MFSKKKICYFAICIIFILLLILSNKIIAAIIQDNVKKSNINIENYKKDIVYYGLDEISYYNDLYDSFFIRGWAFCETVLDNSQKEIWILLVNDKATYARELNLNNNIYIYDKFHSEYNIKGMNHGIYSTISTVGVKNGIYKIYIYCKENNENYGLIDTGKMIKKDNRGISEYVLHASAHDIKETEIGKYANCYIDSALITDEKYLQLTGWAFTEGQNTANQYVYVRLKYAYDKSMTFDTQNRLRVDVGHTFKSHLYDYSGFSTLIPIEILKDGNIEVEILVRNGKSVYLGDKSYVFNVKDNSLKLSKAVIKGNTNQEIKIDPKSIMEDSSVKYNIDLCLVDEFLHINGWTYIDNKKSSETKVYLGVISANGTTHVYDTDKHLRPDVAKFFNNELYTESGFKAVIPIEAISKGENTIIVIADSGKMLKAPKLYTLNIK